MNWIVFTYSLPARQSSLRVMVWRRLRRLGVLAPVSGMSLLPDREACEEAFAWLAQEIQQAGGEALVMRVQAFMGLTDQEIIERFREARRLDYAEVAEKLAETEETMGSRVDEHAPNAVRDTLARLRQQLSEINRIDYFEAPEGVQVAARLARLEEALRPPPPTSAAVTPAALEAYRDARWVTRPRPHVDRLACVWLIRRFIDPAAPVRYADTPEPGEITFDMAGAHFGHSGSRCTFETMVEAFGLHDPALRALAGIVHEIDLRDERFARPETEGVDRILRGWLLAGVTDPELEAHGVALFEGLYAAFAARPEPDTPEESA